LTNNLAAKITFESYIGPILVIITNFILLPRILTFISNIQSSPSLTDNAMSTFRKFYTFLLYQRVLEYLMPFVETFVLSMQSGASFSKAIDAAWTAFPSVFVSVNIS
jgi:hypothetical protein